MSVLLSSVEGHHRHVCTLQALAAETGRNELSIASLQMSRQARGRLSAQLLRWCDDFYDVRSALPQRKLHLSPDTLWLPPVTHVNLFRPTCPEAVTTAIHALAHIDWSYESPANTDRNGLIIMKLRDQFPAIARAALFEFPECRLLVGDMLTRAYKHPLVETTRASLLTRSLLTAGVPPEVRDLIAQLDVDYLSHLQTIMDGIEHIDGKLSFAVRSGNFQFLQANHELISPFQWPVLLRAVCDICDLAMYRCLRECRPPEMQRLSPDWYLTILRTALSSSNKDVLRMLLMEMKQYDVDYNSDVNALWTCTRDAECADTLIADGCPYDTAVFHCRHPRTVDHLIARGCTLTPASVHDAAVALSSNCSIAHLLMNAWDFTSLPALEYICEAIRRCREEILLRELVAIFQSKFNRDGIYDHLLRHCLSVACLSGDMYAGKSFYATCRYLGADVDAQEVPSGKTVLMKLVLAENVSVVRYLVDVGASVNVRDYEGKTVCDMAPPRMRDILKRDGTSGKRE